MFYKKIEEIKNNVKIENSNDLLFLISKYDVNIMNNYLIFENDNIKITVYRYKNKIKINDKLNNKENEIFNYTEKYELLKIIFNNINFENNFNIYYLIYL